MTLTPEPILRRLKVADVPGAFQLSTEAGWNQTENDWRMLIELSPEGCVGVEVDGELAATSTLICYERRLAWIGMVLTRKENRGHGFANRLLKEVIRLADLWNIPSVKLDATLEGQPIYEKLGFRGEQVTERWEREVTGNSELALEDEASAFVHELINLEKRLLGTDRAALLGSLSRRGRSIVAQEGYLLARPGRIRNYIGPCIAESRESARSLLVQLFNSHPQANWYWDLLAENKNAVSLAQEFGFAPKRRLLRMTRGKTFRTNDENVYALAGFEFG